MLHRRREKSWSLLCHGFTGNKIDFNRLLVQAARALAQSGLNALRFDFMGSGDSSGDFNQMSPNTPGARCAGRSRLECGGRRYRKIALLGHSALRRDGHCRCLSVLSAT